MILNGSDDLSGLAAGVGQHIHLFFDLLNIMYIYAIDYVLQD